jgi:stage II sporulation protein R
MFKKVIWEKCYSGGDKCHSGGEKHYSDREKRARKLGVVLLVVVVAIVITAVILTSAWADSVNMNIASNLIRLHITANSDIDIDQQLKLSVRDEVLSYMNGLFDDSPGAGAYEMLVRGRLDEIRDVAKRVVAVYGCNYDVAVSLGDFPFPTKAYGDVTLPAGIYRAVKIDIGSAAGANWWCVMFPPLCFVDATHGAVPESVKADLKNSMNDEDYKIITSYGDEGEIPVKIKFKLVEIFQNSKISFAGLFSQ